MSQPFVAVLICVERNGLIRRQTLTELSQGRLVMNAISLDDAVELGRWRGLPRDVD